MWSLSPNRTFSIFYSQEKTSTIFDNNNYLNMFSKPNNLIVEQRYYFKDNVNSITIIHSYDEYNNIYKFIKFDHLEHSQIRFDIKNIKHRSRNLSKKNFSAEHLGGTISKKTFGKRK